ncbi:hypothetical protein HK102_002417 [Quaeritorhiza haematococci]|nr:hypothetical protein HK102_002417 [Quaeritorhiza haematococci]
MTDTVPEDITEYHDSPEAVNRKARRLADLIRNSKHLIVFTGAGISTSAGIPDFRGPQGVWTLQAKGLPARRTTSTEILPTKTHMALVQLQKRGLLKFVISQNTDGLHLRSGIHPHSIAELHGNTNIEECARCGEKYYRPYRTRSARDVHDHTTGRDCVKCGGVRTLKDTIVNFGEALPATALRDGFDHAGKADVFVVLGSSCRVSPACDMPLMVARRGGRLAIVNLQKTPLDPMATVRIGTQIDDVMERVMSHLGMEIPPVQDLQQQLAEDDERKHRSMAELRRRQAMLERQRAFPVITESRESLMEKSVKELQRILAKRNIDYSDCFEKADLVNKILNRCSGGGQREE